MKNAFSLIEILVALAIVAIAATSTISLSSNVTKEAANTRTRDKMAILAFNKANEISIGNMAQPIDLQGRYTDAPECNYHAKSSSINRANSFKLDVKVTCDDYSYNLERIITR